MKKVMLFLLTIIIALGFSAFTSGFDTKVSIKKAQTDSIATNVNISNHAGKLSISPELDSKLLQFLDLNNQVNNDKLTILNSLVDADFNKEDPPQTRLEKLTSDYGYNQEKLKKDIRRETRIYFWCGLITLLLYAYVFRLYLQTYKYQGNWQVTTATVIVSGLFVYIVGVYLIQIASFLFNSDYINFIKVINL